MTWPLFFEAQLVLVVHLLSTFIFWLPASLRFCLKFSLHSLRPVETPNISFAELEAI